MTNQFENIYAAWDDYAVQGPQAAKDPSLVDFASDYLQNESQKTHLPLNYEQAKLLVRIIDSFVDDAGKRHREFQSDQDAEVKAVKTLAAEYKKPLFTQDEINQAVKSGAEEFVGLTEDEIRDNLEGRKRLFKRFKGLLFEQQGKDFETLIAPYLPEADRMEAKRLFCEFDGKGQETHAGADLEVNAKEHVDFVAAQTVLARGLHARSNAEMLSGDGSEMESDTSKAPQCLVDAFGGKLFSRSEDLVRKLTAVEFLLARMDLEQDQEVALPFLAVGAARAAYDWVTEKKSSYQLATLATILDDLESEKPSGDAAQGVAK